MEKAKLINRLKRSEGQVRGIIKMMEDEKACRDVVIQLAAVKASIEKVMEIMVTENLSKCIEEEGHGDISKRKLEEALSLVLKIR